jgi:hypothetical protein
MTTTLDSLEARVSVLEANAASAGTVLPPRAFTAEEVTDLRNIYPGGADETYTSTLTYRDPVDAASWFDSIFAAYSAQPTNLSNLPHTALMSIPLYAPVSGPWPLGAPQPFPGYTGVTYDPQEILSRALIGQSWTGDPPCGEPELTNRTKTRDDVLAMVPGANGSDWYSATKDALSVLIMGTGFQPWPQFLQPGAVYPCPGVYDLDGVCNAITGGGQP